MILIYVEIFLSYNIKIQAYTGRILKSRQIYARKNIILRLFWLGAIPGLSTQENKYIEFVERITRH
jgi:hypothetical protein